MVERQTDLFSDLDALRYTPPPRLLGGPDQVVELNPVEQMLVQDVARQRCGGGRKDMKVSDRGDAEISLEGIGGELAFCQLFKVYPEQVFYLGPVGNDPGDAVIDGFRIDVKTSKRLDADLIAAQHKAVGRIPIHALMTGSFPRYVFQGFAWSEDLLHERQLVELGYGPTYLYPRRLLRTWKGLMFDGQRVAEWRERIHGGGQS